MSTDIRPLKKRTNSSIVESLLDKYILNLSDALREAHEMFGRSNFERIMAYHLCRHCAKVAFVLAVNYFITKRSYYPR